MKNNYKYLFTLLAFLCCTFYSFAQESPKKPIKALKVFNQDQQVSLGEATQNLQKQLALPQGNSFSLLSEKRDDLGVLHQNFQQNYKGIKVEFASTTLNSKKSMLQSMANNVFRIENLSVTPQISKAVAFQKALGAVKAEAYLWEDKEEAELLGYQKPEGELVVFPPVNHVSEKARLAYKYDIYAEKPLSRADVYVDAKTGEIIMQNDKIHDANTPANGNSLYNGNVSFTANSYNGYYRLRQTVDGGGIQTFDCNNGTSYANASEITSNSTTFYNTTGVQAQWGAEQTYKFYNQKLGRNSYDDYGSVIKSYVSYKQNYVNAFWDGSRMTYGDGDGQNYGPVIALDVVGHEISHGVTEYSAGLVYSYESGALNESFSDVFGESIEKFATGTNDWLLGADIGTAFRSMSNPKSYNNPDTYKGSYWNGGSSDNGGVHTNSGVQNFWFYLLSVGGSGSNDNGNNYNVSGIGMTKAYKIAYRNLTVYLSSNSDYYDARAGAIQSAIDLYGNDSNEEAAVTNAWYAVGVGNAYDGGSTPPPSGDCTSSDIYLSITFDNYPEETGWNLKNSAGTVIDSQDYSSSNPDGSTVTKTFSGLTAGDYTFTITDEYGDGFCCSYGSGSYTLSSDDGTLTTGGEFGNSESTSFCIEDGGSGNDTQVPAAPTNLSASNITTTTVDLSWNASTDNVAVTEYAVYQGGDLLGSTANTSAQITGLTDNASYSFSVKAKDAAGNTSVSSNSVTVQTGGGSSNNNYCDSSGSNASDEWIDLVRLNNLNHTSSSDGGYADNTYLSANLPYGSNKIYISAGFSGYGYTEYWKVWIDFNQDGVFSSSEVIASGSSSSFNTLSSSFNVSNSAISGNTRMRVSMKYNSVQGSCENFSYGEVEDYTVNIGQSTTSFGADSQLSAENLGNEDAVYAVNIYPNPVKGSMLNVSSNDNRDITYQVYDLLGKMVMQGKLSGQAINVNRLSSGVYLLKMNDGQKDIVKKFIKG